MDRNELHLEPRHLVVPSVASKNISKPVVLSAQTMHLSCIKISTISKQTEMSFHLSLVIQQFHWVHPKWFLSLWYGRRKPCTYLAPTQTLSPNEPKWDTTWPTSPRSSIGCVQNKFRAYGMFGANRATYLASRLALSPNGPKQVSTWASSPRITIGCIKNDFWAYGSFGANRAPIFYRH
jgi:hypothetical protein